MNDHPPSYPDEWPCRLKAGLQQTVASEVCKEILSEPPNPNQKYPLSEIGRWTQDKLQSMEKRLTQKEIKDCLTQCTCHILTDYIQIGKEVYQKTGDIAQVHQKITETFEHWLRSREDLKPEWIEFMLSRHWGIAGILTENTIKTTKIPAQTKNYFLTHDPKIKRKLYCHCYRVKHLVNAPAGTISSNYCYCGAGFYRALWEGILERTVNVRVTKSLFQGDDLCQIEIYLDDRAGIKSR